MPELITGTKGTPHVTSTQDRSIYEKIIGKGSYILDDNELLEPELQSNQSLRIRSGMLYHHGSITEVKRNTYDEVTIANGSQGMKRIDLVVARYTKNPETEIEEMNWVVIQGTPAASDPVAPAYTEGNMQEGDLTDDCPVFEVHLDGIQVTEVVKLLKVLDGSLEALNSKIEVLQDADYTTESAIASDGRALKIYDCDGSYGGNVTYGCWNEGMYSVRPYTPGAPSNWGGSCQVTHVRDSSGNFNSYVKTFFSGDCKTYIMRQAKDGTVEQNWTAQS